MKRMACILMVVVMLIPMVGIAETQSRSELLKMVSDYCQEMLVNFCDMYEVFGDKYSDDYVELTYRYYRMWMTVDAAYSTEVQFASRNNPLISGKASGTWKMLEDGNIMMSRTVESKWEMYINGEMTKEDFMGLLVNLIHGKIDANKKAEEAVKNALQ